MKKQYEKPALQTEPFDIEDVITAYGGLVQAIQSGLEYLIEQGQNMFNQGSGDNGGGDNNGDNNNENNGENNGNNGNNENP